MSDKANDHHILPLSIYLRVAVALLILTVITVWVGQIHLGEANLLVAMLIAGIKASLVVLFFMHLKYENKLFAAVFVAALLFVAAFIVFTMADTMTRGEIDEISARPFNNQVQYKAPSHGSEHGAAADSTVHDSAATASDSLAHSAPDSSAEPTH